jgi:hypothetical protein
MLLGGSESRQGPTGTDMLTSAFAESTRAPRPAAAGYPGPCQGPDHGRLLAVDLERPASAPKMTKATAGVVEADAPLRGKARVSQLSQVEHATARSGNDSASVAAPRSTHEIDALASRHVCVRSRRRSVGV